MGNKEHLCHSFREEKGKYIEQDTEGEDTTTVTTVSLPSYSLNTYSNVTPEDLYLSMPKEGDRENHGNYYQGIKVYYPEVLDATEEIDLLGIQYSGNHNQNSGNMNWSNMNMNRIMNKNRNRSINSD